MEIKLLPNSNAASINMEKQREIHIVGLKEKLKKDELKKIAGEHNIKEYKTSLYENLRCTRGKFKFNYYSYLLRY